MANDEVIKPTFPYRGYQPQTPVAKPEDDAKNAKENTVLMYFPSPVLYTKRDHSRVQYNVGVQEVPLSMSKDPYLAAHGATAHTKDTPIKLTDAHVRFLNSPEYRRVTTIADAQAYFDKMSKTEQNEFLTAAAKFDSPVSPDLGVLNFSASTMQQTPDGEDSITEKHVAFLQSKGFKAKTVEEAKNFYSNLLPEQRRSFLNDVNEWGGKSDDEDGPKDPQKKPDVVIEDPKPITTKEADAAKATEAKKVEEKKPVLPATPAKK